MAVLVPEQKPGDESWFSLCEEMGVVLAWPECFEALLAPSLPPRAFDKPGRGATYGPPPLGRLRSAASDFLFALDSAISCGDAFRIRPSAMAF